MKARSCQCLERVVGVASRFHSFEIDCDLGLRLIVTNPLIRKNTRMSGAPGRAYHQEELIRCLEDSILEGEGDSFCLSCRSSLLCRGFVPGNRPECDFDAKHIPGGWSDKNSRLVHVWNCISPTAGVRCAA